MNTYLSDKLKVVSFIAMLLVVFLHSYNLVVRLKSGPMVLDRGYNFFIQEFISQGIARVAVPVFFAISGYLFFLKMSGTLQEFKEKVLKRIKTLLIPYLFWSFWSLLLCFLVQLLPPPRIFFATNLVLNFSTEQLLSTIFLHPIAYQLWFIRDLLVLVVLSPLVFWVIKKTNYFVLPILFGLWLINANLILVSIEATLFFAFGAFLAIRNSSWPLRVFSLKQSLLLIASWFVLLSIRLLLAYINSPYAVLTTILHKSAIILGIMALWALYDSFLQHKKEPLLKLAAYSFFLYAFHEPLLMLLKPALFTIMGKGPINSFLIYIFVPVLSIVLGMLLARQLKQKLPNFYGLITGGR